MFGRAPPASGQAAPGSASLRSPMLWGLAFATFCILHALVFIDNSFFIFTFFAYLVLPSNYEEGRLRSHC